MIPQHTYPPAKAIDWQKMMAKNSNHVETWAQTCAAYALIMKSVLSVLESVVSCVL